MPSKLTKHIGALIVAAGQTAATMLPTPAATVAAWSPLASAPPTTMMTHGWKDWLRAASSSGYIAVNTCGNSEDWKWTCNTHWEVCTNTIASDGRAYQYCSNSHASLQSVYTAVNDYYGGISSSGFYFTPGQIYCPSASPHGITQVLTSDGVTATGFGCSGYNISGIKTWHAYSDMLNPVEYSSELDSWRQAQAPTTSTSSTSTPPHTTAHQHTHTPTPTPNPGGLSTGAKIGIGVGVGVGVLGILIAVATFFFVRRKTRNSAPPSSGPPSYYNNYREPEKMNMGSPQPSYQQSYQQNGQQSAYQPSSYGQSQFSQSQAPQLQRPLSPATELPSRFN